MQNTLTKAQTTTHLYKSRQKCIFRKNTTTMIKKALSSIDTLSNIEKREILVQYKKLQDTFIYRTNKQEQAKIEKAFIFSLKSHANARRKSGIPYIIHPLRVAYTVSKEMRLGVNSILSALLHDVVEDTSVSINDISEKFGTEVSKLVQGLTKIKKVFGWGDSGQAENFKKLFLNLTKDKRIILIKIADRLDNMNSLSPLPRCKQLKIASESKQIYVPLAHRLGLNYIKTELEDLYFRHMYPNAYQDLRKKIAIKTKNRKKIIDVFIIPIKHMLEKQGIKFRIEKRVKSIYSTWEKITKCNIPLEQVYDLIALRIILSCSAKEEKITCWKTYGIVTELYKPYLKQLRDWISTPKSNGYESLHTTVMCQKREWVEVQIRTERMDKIATTGIASHSKYKESSPIFNNMLELWISNVKNTLKHENGNSIKTMENIQLSLYEDEIYVFTKEGVQKILPKGASLLDLAIECMGKEGLKCSSAWINHNTVPLQYPLKNGDQVDFIIDKEQNPEQEWIYFVITPKARKTLYNEFKVAYKRIKDKGKRIITANLKRHGLSFSKRMAELLREFFDEKNPEAVYHKVGKYKISLEDLQPFTEMLKNINPNNNHKKQDLKPPYIDLKLKENGILLEAKNKKTYKLSQCCNPIPGEEIFGITTLDQAVKIHHISCPNSIELLTFYGDRTIKAKWGYQEQLSLVSLAINSINKKSIKKSILNTFQNKFSLELFLFIKKDGLIKIILTTKIKSVVQLKELIQKIQSIKGVINIKRYNRKINSTSFTPLINQNRTIDYF